MDAQQTVQTIPPDHALRDLVRTLRWSRLRLALRAEEALRLPPYKGSTFRGAFGYAFKQVACPLRQACEECLHQAVCVYAYAFETPGADDGSRLVRGRSAAHPFVLEPPETPETDIPPGAELALGLILIGRAIPLAPYFLAACREMGRRGVGQGRRRFTVERATAEEPGAAGARVVYDGSADLLAPAVPVWGVEELWRMRNVLRQAQDERLRQAQDERVTLEFLTPTRLRQEADLVVSPDFATLATALLRRLSVLAELHCGYQGQLPAREILAQTAEIRTEGSDLRWHDWERYSARQDARMSLGGFVGRIGFRGPLGPWLPLLRLGEILHVGKGTAFGLGRYRMEEPCA